MNNILKLLKKLNDLLSEDGVLYFTTPTNAPAIDHIYLFNNVEEIRELARSAGFQIESEMPLISEDVSAEKAEKFKKCRKNAGCRSKLVIFKRVFAHFF